MNKTIVYIGSFQFPMGDAVAKRALGIGKALSSAGYQVLFIGESCDVKRGSISECQKYEEFKYCCIHKAENPAEHYVTKVDFKQIVNQLNIWRKKYELEAIIFCGTKSALFANKLVTYAQKNKLKIVADSMDWLSSHTGNIIFDIIKQADTSFELKVVNKRVDGLICISNFLSEYYTRAGLKTVIIPNLSPYKRPESFELKRNELRFIYAGVPCRLGRELRKESDAKDRLDLAVKLMYELAEMGHRYQFDIFGLDQEQYVIVFPKQKEVVSWLVQNKLIKFWGRKNEQIIKEATINSDFSILLRERNRTSMAGFPTKVSESITLGTPVITTDTSDLKRYLHDGIDSYFVDLDNWDVTVKKMDGIIKMKTEKRNALKNNAIQNNSFYPPAYTEIIKDFFEIL